MSDLTVPHLYLSFRMALSAPTTHPGDPGITLLTGRAETSGPPRYMFMHQTLRRTARDTDGVPLCAVPVCGNRAQIPTYTVCPFQTWNQVSGNGRGARRSPRRSPVPVKNRSCGPSGSTARSCSTARRECNIKQGRRRCRQRLLLRAPRRLASEWGFFHPSSSARVQWLVSSSIRPRWASFMSTQR